MKKERKSYKGSNQKKIVETSCSNCCKYPCFVGIENLESDFGKEGCRNYLVKYNNNGHQSC